MQNWIIDSIIIAIPSGMLALSYYPITGLTRTVPLCNAAWAAVAAYGAVLLAKLGVVPPFAIAISLVASMGAALLTYLVAFRAKGFVQVMVTAASGSLIIGSISVMDKVTGGEQGLLVSPGLLKLERFGTLAVFITLLTLSSLAIVACSHTVLAARLVALRRLEVLISLAGFSTRYLRAISFGASGLLAGISGVLVALSSPALTPMLFNLQISISVLAVFILSGGLSFPPRIIRLASIQILVSFILQILQRSIALSPSVIFSIYYALLAGLLFVSLYRRERESA